MRSKIRAIAAGIAVAAAVGGAPAAAMAAVDDEAAESRPGFHVDEKSLPFEALPQASASWGVVDGAGYRLEVPDEWNGELVVFAHGFRGEAELFVDDPTIRDHLITEGYAWAASSYRTNEFAPVLAAQDTVNLLDLVRDRIGEPSAVYAMGGSLGGYVVKYLAETEPERFAGTLAMCASDVELFDYFQDIFIVGETLVGNSIPDVIPADYGTNGLPALRQALGSGFPDSLNETGFVYKDAIEMLSGGDRPVFDQAWSGPLSFSGIITAQSLAFLGGGLDNSDTIYHLDVDPAVSAEESDLNNDITRVVGSPPFRTDAGWSPNPDDPELLVPRLTGQLAKPVVSLHTLGDLFVPFTMAENYVAKAESAGSSDLLVTRAIRDVNHCGFTDEEVSAAFDDLVLWTKTGERPVGADLTTPASIASADFGCAFTTGSSITRFSVPACPGVEEPGEPGTGGGADPGSGGEPGTGPGAGSGPGSEASNGAGWGPAPSTGRVSTAAATSAERLADTGGAAPQGIVQGAAGLLLAGVALTVLGRAHAGALRRAVPHDGRGR